MELRQLAHFASVVEHGSLGQAAKVLNISEPALSKSLRRLEESLGVPLLDRNSRGMTPTLFGRSFLPHALVILGEVEVSQKVLEELQGVSRGTIRIGTRPTFGSTVLPEAIARLQHRRPKVRVVIREGVTANLIAEVLRGSLDFIVATKVEDIQPSLIQELLTVNQVGIVVREGHPLASKKDLSPNDLADARWVLPLRTDPARRQLESILRRNGLASINVVAETNSVVFTTSYIRQTDAIGYFPRAILRHQATGGGLNVLELPRLEWRQEVNIIRLRHASLAPAAKMLIQEVRTVSA